MEGSPLRRGTQVNTVRFLRRFTAVPPHLRLPCTRSRDRPVCQLLGHLEACNKVLRHLGLRLREDEADGLGELRLEASTALPYRRGPQSKIAIELTTWIIMLHRCLVYVEISFDVVMDIFIIDYLIDYPGVTKLHVHCEIFDEGEAGELKIRCAHCIQSMRHVEELVFSSGCATAFCTVPLETFGLDRAGTRLTTLDVSDVWMSEQTANDFILLLIKNNTVTSLTVAGNVFRMGSFTDYLSKDNPTLKALALKSGYETDTVILRNLVSAVCTMTTLQEMTVEVKFQGAESVAIFAQVVARSRTLRRLSLTWPTESRVGRYAHRPRQATGGHPKGLETWIPALKENSVLERLAMDFLDFKESDCHAFFRALAENKTLIQVTVLNLPPQCDLKAIYGTVRECGLGRRLLIKNHYFDSSPLPTLADCPEVTAVSVDAVSPNLDFPSALGVLSSCERIASISLMVNAEFFSDGASRSLLTFIAGSQSLREISLYSDGSFFVSSGIIGHVAQSAVVQAISSNTWLTTVRLEGLYLSDSDGRMLAEAALCGPNLYHVEFDWCRKAAEHFLRLLAPVVAGNYSVLRVRVYPWARDAYEEHQEVLEAARRNSSLVNRAARFVMGDETSYCARALEFVSRHPKLVDAVAERAAVSCEDAKEMIRRALSSIVGMDGFMRAAGVVKDSVQCYIRLDGQMQLDELDIDCWLHVRKYLKVADVLEDWSLTL